MTTQNQPMTIREFTSNDGEQWEALAVVAIVAHGKEGAVLAFQPAGADGDDLLRSTITFNSMDAADFALRTLGLKELRRRLSLARMAVGGT